VRTSAPKAAPAHTIKAVITNKAEKNAARPENFFIVMTIPFALLRLKMVMKHPRA
jgi:hypothetical protein